MNKKKAILNAIIAAFQTVVSAISLFILYKYLLTSLDVKSIGVWSIVISSASISNLSQFGLSGSVTKFVAKYLARKEIKKVEGVLKTAFSSIGLILLFGVTLAYYPLVWIFTNIMPFEELTTAMSLLPFALVSIWFASLSGVVISGLDGCQRIDFRVSLMIFGIVLFLVCSFVLVPVYGLLGLAFAQIAQNFFVVTFGWLLIKKEIKPLTLMPFGWDYRIFKEIFRYGFNFQLVSVGSMLLDVSTKLLMSKFGGLAMTGYFEMANRMVLQFRAIIVAANQVLVPIVASLYERDAKQLIRVYIESFNLVLIISLLGFSLIATITPFVSEIWIGKHESIFINFAFICIGGWFINSLSGPAFFGNQGTGNLKWNVISTLVQGIINFIIGFIFGSLYGGYGVSISYLIALMIGSSILIISHNSILNIPLNILFKKGTINAVFICSISLVITSIIQVFLYDKHSINILIISSLIIYFMSSFIILKTNNQLAFLAVNKYN